MMSLVGELWQFIKVRKKFWLLPMLLATAMLAGLTILTKVSTVAHFLYVY
jgi:hypothetical protein